MTDTVEVGWVEIQGRHRHDGSSSFCLSQPDYRGSQQGSTYDKRIRTGELPHRFSSNIIISTALEPMIQPNVLVHLIE